MRQKKPSLSKDPSHSLSEGRIVKFSQLNKFRESISYKGVELDSIEEYQLCIYLDELQSNGYVHFWTKSEQSIEVITADSFEFATGTGVRSGKNQYAVHGQRLLDLRYTPDFDITWSEKAEGIFFLDMMIRKNVNPIIKYSKRQVQTVPFLAIGKVSFVDTKGKFIAHRNTSGITFPLIRKILWDKHGIFINKIIPKELFKNTFTPLTHLIRRDGKPRKLHEPVRSLQEYIHCLQPTNQQ